eukprot:TRINITY_DN1590_c0_g1_i2.p1 TRINITY_DN1590_c0_g1~~TRINITY_DN1590_c0_g1_i2.p1  ORF type:complete len:165 (-),score=45.63 TRINITY_DN1590_c0_g1_i2:468-962(-)
MEITSNMIQTFPAFLQHMHASADVNANTRSQIRRFLTLARKHKVFSETEVKLAAVVLQRFEGAFEGSFYEAFVLAAMLMAKINMDVPFDNDAFAQISGISLHRINQLEINLLISGVDLDAKIADYHAIDVQIAEYIAMQNTQPNSLHNSASLATNQLPTSSMHC